MKFFADKWIILAGWTVLNGWLLWHNGIVTAGESQKYIDEAHVFIQTHQLSSSNFWLYFTQIALLAFCFKFNTGFVFAVAIQLMLNLSATLFFYHTVKAFFPGTRRALLATLLLLASYPYQEFNTFLQTESIFYSLTLILSCLIIHPAKTALKRPFLLLLLLALVCFTRPTGLLFLPPVGICLFLYYARSWSPMLKTVTLIVSAGLFFYGLNSALGSGGELDFMLPFKDEENICGVPTLTKSLPLHLAGNGNSLYGLLYYVLHNFPQFVRLAASRSLAFFGMYRSYYSRPHNWYIVIFFNLIFLAALLSLSCWKRKFPLALGYFAGIIFLTWFTVMLTCDDWHNRFYLTISPFLIILSMGFLGAHTKRPADAR